MAYRLVLSTASSRKEALKLANLILSKKLAACVTAVPGAVSHYRWKGGIVRSKEVLLLIKTTVAVWPRVLHFLKKNHPYDNPEILALPVTEGSKEYLSWLNASVKK